MKKLIVLAILVCSGIAHAKTVQFSVVNYGSFITDVSAELVATKNGQSKVLTQAMSQRLLTNKKMTLKKTVDADAEVSVRYKTVIAAGKSPAECNGTLNFNKSSEIVVVMTGPHVNVHCQVKQK